MYVCAFRKYTIVCQVRYIGVMMSSDAVYVIMSHVIMSSDADIRYCVLMALEDKKFDPHLAQAENLSALFVALNDEVFEIRELAMCTIGRLSGRNPAYVMPSLRKVLIQVSQKDRKTSVIFACRLSIVHVQYTKSTSQFPVIGSCDVTQYYVTLFAVCFVFRF